MKSEGTSKAAWPTSCPQPGALPAAVPHCPLSKESPAAISSRPRGHSPSSCCHRAVWEAALCPVDGLLSGTGGLHSGLPSAALSLSSHGSPSALPAGSPKPPHFPLLLFLLSQPPPQPSAPLRPPPPWGPLGSPFQGCGRSGAIRERRMRRRKGFGAPSQHWRMAEGPVALVAVGLGCGSLLGALCNACLYINKPRVRPH